jgi:hypothetical protein
MLKKALILTLIGVTLHTAQADIYISEVVEGSSNNKAIEIANNGSSPVTLTNFELASEFSSAWNNQFDLSGVTIAANDVWVIANSSADADLLAKADQTSSSFLVRFSGNDALALLLNGAEHDVFGAFGFDNFNQNVTLRRCNHTPSVTYKTWQWQEFAQDTIDNIGVFNAEDPACVEPEPPVIPTGFSTKTIMELQGSGSHSPFTDVDNDIFTSTQTFKVTGVVTAIQSAGLGDDLPTGFFIQDATGDADVNTSDALFVEAGTKYMTAQGVTTQGDIAVGDELTLYGVVKEESDWTVFEVNESNTFELIFRESTGNVIAVTPLRKLSTDATFDNTLERHENMHVSLDADSDMVIARTFGFDFGVFRNNAVVTHGGVNFHPNQKFSPGSQESNNQRANNEANRIVIESFSAPSNGNVTWYPNFGQDNGSGNTDDYIRVGASISGLEGMITYSRDEYRLFTTNQIDENSFTYEYVADRFAAPELAAGGDLKIVVMNVLNFFNSPFGGAPNPLETNRGAEDQDDFEVQRAKIVSAIAGLDADILGLMEIENNGYDSDSALVELVNLINAEFSIDKQYVIARSERSKRIGTDAISSQILYRRSKIALDRLDVITMPYQKVPAEFYPTKYEGDWEDFRPGSKFMRNSVTPVFTLVDQNSKKLVVSLNHFKSKGSTCWEDLQVTKTNDDGEVVHVLEDTYFQGNCENFRVAAADYLGRQLEKYQGYRVIIGDLNSYATEDPLMVLTNRSKLPAGRQIKAGRNVFVGSEEIFDNSGKVITKSYGYVNAITTRHEDAISYSFNDEVGSLDHILVTSDLNPFIVDATDWNINSVESTLFQYEDRFTGSLPKYTDAFRSSDHDPALLSLNILPDLLTVGSTINLPATAQGIPSASKPVEGKSYRAVLDLTQFSVSSMKVGERINLVLSDKNTNGVVTNSQLARIDLTQSQIERGWVDFLFQPVVEGSLVIEGFYGTELVTVSQVTVEDDDKNSAGGLNILTLMSLFILFGSFRLFSLSNKNREERK